MRGLLAGLLAVLVASLMVGAASARHRAPDPRAKLIRVGECLDIRAERSTWTLEQGSCADMSAFIIKYFLGKTNRCHQPTRNRVVCNIGYGETASAVRSR